MVYLLVFIAVLAALGFGLVVGMAVTRRTSAAPAADTEEVVAAALQAVRHERAESMQAALDTALSVASSKLGDQLHAGRQVLDRERDTMVEQVAGVHGELRRMSELVTGLQKDRAEQDGRLTANLESTMAVTAQLADTTTSLRDALASPKSRGQWGERMAEDVLRLAGFVEGVNYSKQTQVAGGGLPDYTFNLPKGHIVNMDVKFPVDNYLRFLEADSPAEQEQFAKHFRRDVRQRVKELADRAYIDPAVTVDYLLLFIPNESVYGFLHEHDPGLIDAALAQKVVLCSPTSLFAVLAVIRQAVDNFLVERRSDEILSSISGLREQWQKFNESVDKVGRGLQSAQKGYDDLVGPRTRQFEKQLDKLEHVRDAAQSRRELDQSESAALGHDEATQPSLRQVV